MNRSKYPNPALAILVLIIIPMIYLACAEIGAPPGGEIDKTGPFMVGSVPASGELNVLPTNLITIIFSEPLIEPITRSVFISPRPKIEPKVKFKKNIIEIELAEPFAPDQTYIVSLHSQITDRRRNKIDSLASIAFSTGKIIDSGSIAGTVLSLNSNPLDNKPAVGSLVGLWNMNQQNDTIPIDSIYPAYLTSTGKMGEFIFEFLPDGNYQLVAFADLNKDERLNPTKEPLALPDRLIDVGGQKPLNNLLMRLAQEDTTSINILSVSYSKDQLVRVRLSKPLKPSQLSSDISGGPFLQLSDDSTTRIEMLNHREETDDSSSIANFYFGSLTEGQYDLFLPITGVSEPLKYVGLNIRTKDDDTPPVIDKRTPGNLPVFASEAQLSFRFSEMIDTTLVTDQTFTLWNNEDEMLSLERQWLNPFELELSAELLAGEEYQLTLTEFEISDLNGNLLGDSLIDFSIRLFDNDSLGSISGLVTLADSSQAASPILIELVKLDTRQHYEPILNDSGKFVIELPAGKYLLWGLIDTDNNGQLTDGRWSPLSNSETVAIYSDTIKVRARFETSGVDFVIE